MELPGSDLPPPSLVGALEDNSLPSMLGPFVNTDTPTGTFFMILLRILAYVAPKLYRLEDGLFAPYHPHPCVALCSACGALSSKR